MGNWLIRGGKLASDSSLPLLDVRVRGEVITEMGPNLTPTPGERLLDANGLLVLPGLVDMHTHFSLRVSPEISSESFAVGTRRAILGGVTSVVDFADQVGDDLLAGLRRRVDSIGDDSLVDYSLHAVVTDWNSVSGQVDSLPEHGFSTLKMFTVYEERAMRSSYEAIAMALEASARSGLVVLVHAEDQDICNGALRRLVSAGKTTFSYFSASRPAHAEASAVHRLLGHTLSTGGRLHLVHLSSGESVALVREARHKGVAVTAETTPLYLATDESLYRSHESHLLSACPPIRTDSDRQALWAGLLDETISAVATDTCGFSPDQKAPGRADFRQSVFGVSLVEALLPFLYTRGVGAGEISLPHLCRIACEEPARICGLYPRKGVLRPGSDADIVLMDPSRPRLFSPARLSDSTPVSPVAGWKLSGWPLHVLRRGELVLRQGQLTAAPSPGRFLPQVRQRFAL